jgi:2-polyprenyl-6-methoxyphenol hydroxylase-like FAD-dependent oxidoreductase
MNRNRILVSGAGIAGLTLAIQLKQSGFEPLVIERERAPRNAGYMMDFFGSGWDVASRLGLIERLRAVRYPIEALGFVGADGEPYLKVPVARIRDALGGRYMYLRRPDLEQALLERAREAGIDIRYGTWLHALNEFDDCVHATFVGGATDNFALVIGADGAHSGVRRLAFGPERRFARFLGLYVAAFHLGDGAGRLGGLCKLYEETNRSAFFYPLDSARMDATYVFRHDAQTVPPGRSLAFVRAHYDGGGWITADVLRDYRDSEPIFFDRATQIVMPRWHDGRIALVGDACGCLTLLAGQGSHMAMAGAYLLARELARHNDHRDAFAAYQDALKPQVDRKQREAARYANLFVPSARSRPWLRRLVLHLIFSAAGLRLMMRTMGRGVLPAGL